MAQTHKDAYQQLLNVYNSLFDYVAHGGVDQQATLDTVDKAIQNMHCCSECYDHMGAENCGDEFWEERVCDECSNIPE